jgi:hypothetical protein
VQHPVASAASTSALAAASSAAASRAALAADVAAAAAARSRSCAAATSASCWRRALEVTEPSEGSLRVEEVVSDERLLV